MKKKEKERIEKERIEEEEREAKEGKEGKDKLIADNNNLIFNNVKEKNKKKVKNDVINDKKNKNLTTDDNKIIISNSIAVSLRQYFQNNIQETTLKNKNKHFRVLELLEFNGLTKIKNENVIGNLTKSSQWRLSQTPSDPSNPHKRMAGMIIL